MEDKQEIVMHLKWLLLATRAGSDVETLVLSKDETTVTISFSSGFTRDVNIECDSGIMIIQDVVKALY